MHLTATTQFGLEELLADELYTLGADITHVGSRAVEFIGDHRLLALKGGRRHRDDDISERLLGCGVGNRPGEDRGPLGRGRSGSE